MTEAYQLFSSRFFHVISSPQAGGYPNVPGIWSDAQIAGWKKLVDEGTFEFMLEGETLFRDAS